MGWDEGVTVVAEKCGHARRVLGAVVEKRGSRLLRVRGEEDDEKGVLSIEQIRWVVGLKLVHFVGERRRRRGGFGVLLGWKQDGRMDRYMPGGRWPFDSLENSKPRGKIREREERKKEERRKRDFAKIF